MTTTLALSTDDQQLLASRVVRYLEQLDAELARPDLHDAREALAREVGRLRAFAQRLDAGV